MAKAGRLEFAQAEGFQQAQWDEKQRAQKS